MSIHEQLATERVAAMKAGDRATVNVIRQIETEVALAKSAKGFHGEVDDELYLKTIASYTKKMGKARAEFEAAGERGAEQVAKLAFEIDYLAKFLPQQLSDEETRQLVRRAIADTGAAAPGDRGRVIGAVMKSGAEVDGGTVARIVAEELGG